MEGAGHETRESPTTNEAYPLRHRFPSIFVIPIPLMWSSNHRFSMISEKESRLLPDQTINVGAHWSSEMADDVASPNCHIVHPCPQTVLRSGMNVAYAIA